MKKNKVLLGFLIGAGVMIGVDLHHPVQADPSIQDTTIKTTIKNFPLITLENFKDLKESSMVNIIQSAFSYPAQELLEMKKWTPHRQEDVKNFVQAVLSQDDRRDKQKILNQLKGSWTPNFIKDVLFQDFVPETWASLILSPKYCPLYGHIFDPQEKKEIFLKATFMGDLNQYLDDLYKSGNMDKDKIKESFTNFCKKYFLVDKMPQESRWCWAIYLYAKQEGFLWSFFYNMIHNTFMLDALHPHAALIWIAKRRQDMQYPGESLVDRVERYLEWDKKEVIDGGYFKESTVFRWLILQDPSLGGVLKDTPAAQTMEEAQRAKKKIIDWLEENPDRISALRDGFVNFWPSLNAIQRQEYAKGFDRILEQWGVL